MFKKVRNVKEKEEEELKKRLISLKDEKEKLKKELELLYSEYEELKKSVNSLEKLYTLKGVMKKIELSQERILKIDEEEKKILEKLMEVKRELKSIEILEKKKEREKLKKEISIMLQQTGFLHIIKKSIGAFLLLSLLLFGETAPQKAVKKEFEKSLEKDFNEVIRIIEEKIKLLREERKKLEALKKAPLTEEEKKKVEKIVKAVEKAPADEIAPAIENLPPRLAAEVILRLKPRKAGEILSNMNPKKASEIMRFILSKNPEFAKNYLGFRLKYLSIALYILYATIL